MGNCISSTPDVDVGISSAQLNNSSKKVNRFHDGNQATGPSSNYNNARNTKVLRRPKKIHKGLIGLPANFQHTGHIGIAEMRSGKVDPEKIRSAMSEIAGTINLDITDSTKLSSTEAKLNMTSEGLDSSSVSSSKTPQRKSTPQPITTPNSPQSQISSRQSSSQISPISSDPMAEIVAALRMPSDGNFDLPDENDLTTVVA
ncbi:13257_t:CDS:2 [Acaulospora colombiana]|uniref:13257_t:CDS:1 n=1 Tax=Acaulospora colombiana TaxID=27376 RepID=A0ACA9LDS2_9GLOM|nr:13257_t:CDS:2 [Acaulospora colombiana]